MFKVDYEQLRIVALLLLFSGLLPKYTEPNPSPTFTVRMVASKPQHTALSSEWNRAKVKIEIANHRRLRPYPLKYTIDEQVSDISGRRDRFPTNPVWRPSKPTT